MGACVGGLLGGENGLDWGAACEGRQEEIEMWDFCTWGFECFRGMYSGWKVLRPSEVIAEMEFGVSRRFVRMCHSRWCLILVPVCRCGGDHSAGVWVVSTD